MAENSLFTTILFLVTLSLCIASPVCAIVQESTYLGRVIALDPMSLTLTIRAESQYECNNTDGQPSCGFMPIRPLPSRGSSARRGCLQYIPQ